MGKRPASTAQSKALRHQFQFVFDLDAQERTRRSMFDMLCVMARGVGVAAALREIGRNDSSYRTWRRKYEAFADTVDMLTKANAKAAEAAVRQRRAVRLGEQGLVYDPDRELPDKGDLATFRWNAFGRPTLPHHETAVKAFGDRTARIVFYFAPVGSGKDTLAGDAVCWLKVDNRGQNRVGWFMETEGQSVRRLKRIGAYLTDPNLYAVMPAETPGGQVPIWNIPQMWGPFRWVKGMVYPDGTPVPRATWEKHQFYFVGGDVNEADPDLWASGVDGAAYGARIRTLILSDPFTLENQRNPGTRAEQLGLIRTTLESRMDGVGRMWVLGTTLPVENNYEVMLEEQVGTAGVIYSDENVTRYRNGVVVIRHQAILDEGSERERSFWEDKFPFRTKIYVPDGTGGETEHVADDLSDDELLEAAERGGRTTQGLVDMRGEPGTPRWASFQATHQQRRVASVNLTDFTDVVLDQCDDPTRTYGVRLPHEIAIIGADPARVYGAAWLAWAVDRQAETATAVDWLWDKGLGSEGIKTRLIMGPITAWNPLWYCYETNRHEGELDDTLIQELLRSMAVNIDRVQTDWINRRSDSLGPAQMVGDMRSGMIRFPTKTAEDRARTAKLKEQFRAWDRRSAAPQRRKPGQAGHEPDDLCMAAWVGYRKVREVLAHGRSDGPARRPVPSSVMRRWEAARRRWDVNRRIRDSDRTARRLDAGELVTMFLDEGD